MLEKQKKEYEKEINELEIQLTKLRKNLSTFKLNEDKYSKEIEQLRTQKVTKEERR